MYRPCWFVEVADGRNVLTMALDIHCTKTGSMERPPEHQEADIRALDWLIHNWTFSDSYFDTCVMRLIICALEEKSWLDTTKSLESTPCNDP